jgi:predicted HTH domain antitoxin
LIVLRKKLKQQISDEELEKTALEVIDRIIEKLEKENIDLASTVVVLEKTLDNALRARVEVELYSDVPLIPSVDEKAAEVIDVARRKIEDELLEEDKKPQSY